VAGADRSTDRRLGLAFLGSPTIPETVALAQKAERAGFESVWVAETRITRDAVVPLAAIAAATERVRLGTAIVNVFTRGPVVIAITFLGLDELAPGRIVMGLGTGSPRILAPQGHAFVKALTRLREYCEVLRPLMRGEEVSYEGTTIRLERARVEDILAGGSIASVARDIPLFLGVTGPRSLELAGAVADGVLLNVCLPTAYVERARDLIARGASSAGRSGDDVEVGMMTVVSPDADSRAAKDRASRFIAVYLSMFPNIARETGVPPELLDAVGRELEARGVEAAAALVGDDVVDSLVVAGTPEQCARRLDAYRAAGAALQVLVPLEGAVDAVIDTFGRAPAG
jgi:5,10-methylenetetrahydromethanopterin reductase